MWTLILLAGASLAQPKAQLPIVDRAIEHHGGARCQNARVKWLLTDPSEPGPISFESTHRGGQFDLRFRVDAKMNGKPFTRQIHLTNTTVEQSDNGEELELEEEDRKQATKDAQYIEYFPRLPCQLNDPSVRKEDLGLERWGKQELHKVKVTFDPAGEEFLFWFDPKTGRMQQFGYRAPGELRFHRAVEFHQVNGILFSDQEKFVKKGKRLKVELLTEKYVKQMKRLGVAKLSKIEVEPLVPDQAASRPAK